MTSCAPAKTSAIFNNGMTSVEIVDSDNDDIGFGRSGVKHFWSPSVNKLRQLFTSSSATMSSNNKRHWRRRQTKQDTENEQYYDQDEDQDDYSDNQEVHQQVDETRSGSKSRDIEGDEDDYDEEDQDEDRQVRKKMIRKQNKKEVEVKKKSKCFQMFLYLVLRYIPIEKFMFN